ncbi:MAG: antibiotic biosynthesis monooxygenase [Polyangiaceae bacterium]|nr:antibiotic biosynthesis monooxygenase [Polyangiaceae bacterium]
MYVVCVRIQVLPERVEEFIEATKGNYEGTRTEPGNVRFDVLRGADDPYRFFLYEVYRDETDFKAHQQTPHYLKWRETVAPMMAVPRIGEKYANLFPDPWG